MEESAEQTRILFAVTESKRYGYPYPSGISKRAFQWTLDRIVHNRTNAFHFSFIHIHSPAATSTQSERNNTNGEALLQYFVNRCNELHIDFEVINKEGLNVNKIIRKETKRRMPNLLIVGRIARRHTGLDLLKRIFSAKVSEYCLKHATCPVLTYKCSEDDNNVEEIAYDLVVDA